MDQRQTFGTLEELKAIMINLRLSHARVSLLINRGGLTRIEGIVTSGINEHLSDAIVVTVGNTQETISLQEIVAVNGILGQIIQNADEERNTKWVPPA